MTDDIDNGYLARREDLFKEYRKSSQDLNDLRGKLRKIGDEHEQVHKEANDHERTHSYLRQVVDLVLSEDEDPVMAKFRIRDQMERREKDHNVLSPSIGYVITEETAKPARRGRFSRAWRAFRREWND